MVSTDYSVRYVVCRAFVLRAYDESAIEKILFGLL